MSTAARTAWGSLTIVGTVAALAMSSLTPAALGGEETDQAFDAPVAPQMTQNQWKPVKDNTTVNFTVGLKRRDSAAVDQIAEVSDPTSQQYRRFPDRSAIRNDYGARSNSLDALRSSAKSYDLEVRLDRTGVFATVTGRAGDMGKWLGKPVKAVGGAASGLVFEILRSQGTLPDKVSKKVRELVAVDVKTDADPQAQARALPPYEGINEGTPISCYPEDLKEIVYGYNQLRTAYGVDDLPASDSVAKNARIAILALEDGYTSVALKGSADCFEVGRSIFTRRPVQGLRTQLPQATEGQVDVQTVQAVLPAGSRVDVVEQSPYDGRWHLAWAKAFALPRMPDVITVSYGVCEQEYEGGGGLKGMSKSLVEAVLQRLALAGTSVFASAGDQGSSDCVENNGTGKGNKKLAVDYPGTSPYVTSVGGTRIILDAANNRTGEWVWNSTAQLPPDGPLLGGGGGGTSRWFERPWWQPKSMTKSSSRTVPDVSAHAAPGPNWPYLMSEGPEVLLSGDGGTSFAAPFTAAAVAVIVASQRAKGKPPLGTVQPFLYRLSQQHPAAFYDVVDGNNDVYDRGCCSAKVGYDKASGLGSPNFALWLEHLPKPGR